MTRREARSTHDGCNGLKISDIFGHVRPPSDVKFIQKYKRATNISRRYVCYNRESSPR